MTIGAQPLKRADGRLPGDLRPISMTLGVQKWAEGSCLIKLGGTEVLCAATIEDKIPPHLRGKGTGWVTAEYSMLPRATSERSIREATKGKVGGRTYEIQRLVGRSAAGRDRHGQARRADDHPGLRRDQRRWGHAHRLDHRRLGRPGRGPHNVRHGALPHRKVAAVSVGILGGRICLDLDYSEDSGADVDFNVVATDAGRYVELQGTAEGKPFGRADVDGMLDMAAGGIERLFAAQAEAIASVKR